MLDFLADYRAAAKEPGVLQVLAPDGKVNDELIGEGARLNDKEAYGLYEIMLSARALDRQATGMQRQGRIKGTYAPSEGEEATDVGSAFVLEKADWAFPYYRQLGMMITRKVPLTILLAKMIGNSGDPNKGRQLPVEWGFRDYNIASIGAPIGPNIIHAVGVAWSMKYRQRNTITMAYFGDGATSSNDFHSALNFASVFKVPVVFICSNNQYAISTPVGEQTAVSRLSTKALAYGLEGLTVDGLDLFAIHKAAKFAADKARKERLPTMIECVNYRFGPHTTSDDPLTRYRSAREVDEWKRKDPLIRLGLFLKNSGLLSEGDDREIRSKVETQVKSAIKEAEMFPPVPSEEFVADVYSEVDWHLREEFEEIMLSREVNAIVPSKHG